MIPQRLRYGGIRGARKPGPGAGPQRDAATKLWAHRLPGRHDLQNVIHDVPRHAAIGARVSEERAEIERAGEEIEYQIEVQIPACFASNPRSLQRVTHRLASRGKHL